MRDKKSFVVSCILVVVLVGASLFIVMQKRILNSINASKDDTGIEINSNIIEWVLPPKDGEFEQPEGMGIERQITDIDAYSGMASIKLSGGNGKNQLTLVNNDDEVIIAAEQLVEVVDKGKYKCSIDWYEYEISTTDYYVLLSLVGKMYEDKLNENTDNYIVITNQPTMEQLQEVNIPVFFDIDKEGYLTLYCDIITQDKSNNTEVEEIKAFTVYYEGDILTFKE